MTKPFMWWLGCDWVHLCAFPISFIIVVVKWTALQHMVLVVNGVRAFSLTILLYYIFYWSLHSGNLPSHLEPLGLYRSDSKSTDGISIFHGSVVNACYRMQTPWVLLYHHTVNLLSEELERWHCRLAISNTQSTQRWRPNIT